MLSTLSGSMTANLERSCVVDAVVHNNNMILESRTYISLFQCFDAVDVALDTTFKMINKVCLEQRILTNILKAFARKAVVVILRIFAKSSTDIIEIQLEDVTVRNMSVYIVRSAFSFIGSTLMAAITGRESTCEYNVYDVCPPTKSPYPPSYLRNSTILDTQY